MAQKAKHPDVYNLELTLLEPLLGTASANPELFEEFIASKAPEREKTDEEVEALPDIEEEIQKATTVFPRNAEGEPILWDYQIKGFCKDACGMLWRAKDRDTASAKLTAYKKVIDGLLFVYPRKIPLILPDGGSLGECQRPLRAQGKKGERVTLARSETAPAGTKIRCEIHVMTDALMAPLEEWLDYGKLRGLGQWRNSGMGRFEWKDLDA
jgi:hypothetical protein